MATVPGRSGSAPAIGIAAATEEAIEMWEKYKDMHTIENRSPKEMFMWGYVWGRMGNGT